MVGKPSPTRSTKSMRGTSDLTTCFDWWTGDARLGTEVYMGGDHSGCDGGSGYVYIDPGTNLVDPIFPQSLVLPMRILEVDPDI